jgi:hypothetical protein
MNEARHNPRAREYKGPNVVLDARARVLQPGDEVIVNGPGPFYFRVVEIGPMLDPRMPPGSMHVAFGTVLHFTAQRGQVNAEFVRVRTAEEAGPMPMAAKEDEHDHDHTEPPAPDAPAETERDFRIITPE